MLGGGKARGLDFLLALCSLPNRWMLLTLRFIKSSIPSLSLSKTTFASSSSCLLPQLSSSTRSSRIRVSNLLFTSTSSTSTSTSIRSFHWTNLNMADSNPTPPASQDAPTLYKDEVTGEMISKSSVAGPSFLSFPSLMALTHNFCTLSLSLPSTSLLLYHHLIFYLMLMPPTAN